MAGREREPERVDPERVEAEVVRLMDTIWEEAKAQGVTIRRLGEMSGFSHRGIYAWRKRGKDHRSPNLYSLLACCEALGLRVDVRGK